MYFSKTTAATALLATQALAQNGSYSSGGGYMCPIQMSTQDMTAVEYGWVVQNFLYQYYKANGEFSASDFMKVPMADMMASNGMSRAENLATNMNGLTTQARLAVTGLQELGATAMDCDYSYPPSVQDDPMAFVVAAAYIEATLCGTFIGLADYSQQPTTSFLFARVAAEHGIHGSFLRSLMDPTPYSANSTMLTPAFTPMQALQRGSGEAVRDNVGNLGAFIPSSCAPVPEAPCGGNVEIGMVNAQLNGGGPRTATPISTAMDTYTPGYATKTYSGGMVYSYETGPAMPSSATDMPAMATPSSTGSSVPGGGVVGGSDQQNGSMTSPMPQQYSGAASKGGSSMGLLGAAGAFAALFA